MDRWLEPNHVAPRTNGRIEHNGKSSLESLQNSGLGTALQRQERVGLEPAYLREKSNTYGHLRPAGVSRSSPNIGIPNATSHDLPPPPFPPPLTTNHPEDHPRASPAFPIHDSYTEPPAIPAALRKRLSNSPTTTTSRLGFGRSPTPPFPPLPEQKYEERTKRGRLDSTDYTAWDEVEPEGTTEPSESTDSWRFIPLPTRVNIAAGGQIHSTISKNNTRGEDERQAGLFADMGRRMGKMKQVAEERPRKRIRLNSSSPPSDTNQPMTMASPGLAIVPPNANHLMQAQLLAQQQRQSQHARQMNAATMQNGTMNIISQGANPGAIGNPQFGQGLDPRFNEPSALSSMHGNQNVPLDVNLRAMLSQLSPQQQQRFRNLPPDKLNEILMKLVRGSISGPQGQPRPGLPINPMPPFYNSLKEDL